MITLRLSDAARHVDLEDEWLSAAKSITSVFVAESSFKKASGFKRFKNWKNNKKEKNVPEGPRRKT